MWDFLNKYLAKKSKCNNNVPAAVKAAELKKRPEDITSLSELEEMLAVESDERAVFYLRRRYNRLCMEQILNSSVQAECCSLLDKIDSEEVHGSIAAKCRLPEIAVAAAKKIGNVEIIAKTLRLTEDKHVAAALLEKDIPHETLMKLTGAVQNSNIRKLVKARYEQLQAQAVEERLPENEPEHSISRWKTQIDALEALCVETEQSVIDDLEKARAVLDELHQRWLAVEPIPTRFMEILEKRFKKAGESLMENAKRQEEDNRRRTEHLLAMEELCRKAEALASAEYHEGTGLEFDALRDRWNSFADLLVIRGPLEERFKHASAVVDSRREELQQQINELLAELDGFKNEIDKIIAEASFKESAERVRAIRDLINTDIRFNRRFCREKVNELRALCHKFFVKLKDMYEAAEYERCTNALKKEDLCREAEALLENNDFYHVSKELKRLHAAWRDLGRAHREEEDQLWARFKTLCDQLHQRCTEFFDQLTAERQSIIERKKEMVAEAVAISADPGDWHVSAERLKEIQRQWKEVGFGPREEEQQLYAQLREACDSFFNQRKQHYEEMSMQWQEHEKQKQVIIDEVAAFYGMNFKNAVNRLKELRVIWRDCGRVSQEKEHELYAKFNAAVDAYFASVDAAREDNLKLKLQLCEKAEQMLAALNDNINFNEMNAAVEALMTEWKNVGPAPREMESELWQRFDAPIKTFYDRRKEKFHQLEEQRTENMKIKMQLIEDVENIVKNTENWNDDAARIKELQFRWKETGSTFHDKEQELWVVFHGLCDDFFNRRKDFFEQRHAQQEENMKRKLALCVEMEKIAGIGAPEDLQLSHVSLADELACALKSGGVADLNHQQTVDAANKLCDEWRECGYCGKNEEALYFRFKRAHDVFFKPRHHG